MADLEKREFQTHGVWCAMAAVDGRVAYVQYGATQDEAVRKRDADILRVPAKLAISILRSFCG